MSRGDYHTISVYMTKTLRKELGDAKPKGMQNKDFYSLVAETYIEAWTNRRVPRAFVGKGDASQTTMQVREDVYQEMLALSKSEGETISTYMRTACAYYLFRAKTFDPHDSHDMRPEPSLDEAQSA